jgi:hypothetical protein
MDILSTESPCFFANGEPAAEMRSSPRTRRITRLKTSVFEECFLCVLPRFCGEFSDVSHEPREKIELYDLSNDPGEQQDSAAERTVIVRALRENSPSRPYRIKALSTGDVKKPLGPQGSRRITIANQLISGYLSQSELLTLREMLCEYPICSNSLPQ